MGGREKGKLEKAEGKREKVSPGILLRMPLGNQTARRYARMKETISRLDSPSNLRCARNPHEPTGATREAQNIKKRKVIVFASVVYFLMLLKGFGAAR